jgi:hypothetical protein
MRKQLSFTLSEQGRLLTFLVREMSAYDLESWLIRADRLLHDDEKNDPFRATNLLLSKGAVCLNAKSFDQAQVLHEDMLQTCSIVLDDGETAPLSINTIDNYLEDVRTLFALRLKILGVQLRFATQGVRTFFRLPRDAAYRQAVEKYTFAKSVNVPAIAAALIGQRVVSLADLQSAYSFGDALDILEVLNVYNYNQWQKQEIR